jgi:hypothetical protein
MYVEERSLFEEVFCQCFLLFDRIWVGSNAGYMDFPVVLNKVSQVFEEVRTRAVPLLKSLTPPPTTTTDPAAAAKGHRRSAPATAGGRRAAGQTTKLNLR